MGFVFVYCFTEFGAIFSQGILHETNERMPVSLRDKSVLSLLGYCSADLSCNGELSRVRMEEGDESVSSSCQIANLRSICECHKVDRRISIGNIWIRLVCQSWEKFGRDTICSPRLHHIHWNDQIVSRCDVHVCKS